MENLVNKRVRLRNQLSEQYLVACSDKKSVSPVFLDDKKPKPENSVWKIKSNHPKQSIRLESVYGKLLALKEETGPCAIQVDRRFRHETYNWWRMVDADEGDFTSVQLRAPRGCTNYYSCLYPNDSQVIIGSIKKEKGISLLIACLADQLFTWDLEIVEDPIIDLGWIMGDPPTVEGIPSASSFYQVDKMYVYQQGMPGAAGAGAGVGAGAGLFPNYANSGCNVNESGTQIVGGVNVQTHIDKLVNNQTVKRRA